MLMAFSRVAAMIHHMGGEVSFEWPRYASGWSLPELIALIEQFSLLIDAFCDGCAFGLVGKDNLTRLSQPETEAMKIISLSCQVSLSNPFFLALFLAIKGY